MTVPVGHIVSLYGGRHVGDVRAGTDDAGRIVPVTRVLDQWPLDAMLRRGTIARSQWEVGDDFRRLFHIAHLSGYASMATVAERIDGGRHELSDSVVAARRRVAAAVSAVGQLGGSALWHVVGVGETLDRWAWRCRASGWQMSPRAAAGAVAVALDALRRHWGRLDSGQ